MFLEPVFEVMGDQEFYHVETIYRREFYNTVFDQFENADEALTILENLKIEEF